MNDAEIIQQLKDYGHLDYPFDEKQEVPAPGHPDYPTSLDEPAAKLAVESYQDFMAVSLEPLIAKHHPERRSLAVKVDGEVGPAMQDLFSRDRCGMADYGEAAEEPAVGAGPWKTCHAIGNFHAVSIRVTNEPPPFLAPLFPEIQRRVTAAYDEVGLRIYWDARPPVNIEFTFVGQSNGWIGLAQLGNNSMGCNSGIWCKYLNRYRGGSSNDQIIEQWTTLIKHELAHNCGSGHTRGGVLNASILNGLPTSWRNDVLWPWLSGRFGGEPVQSDEPIPPPPGDSGSGVLTINGVKYATYLIPLGE